MNYSICGIAYKRNYNRKIRICKAVAVKFLFCVMFDSLKWLFFDVGYTLVNEDEVWRVRCREQSECSEAVSLGLSETDIYNEIVNASVSFKPQFNTLIEKYGFKYKAPYRSEYEQLYPCVPSLLEYLSSKYRIGIIANQKSGLYERLCEFGIADYLALTVSSSDCGYSKPDIRIFDYALDRCGCDPLETVMIGDRLDNDILPAKTVGMKTIWVKQGFGGIQTPVLPEHYPDLSVLTIDGLAEIL